MVVIAIISNPKKLSGRLTLWATGSPAYHIAFVDLATYRMYDMNLLFRRRLWPHYPDQVVKLYKCPVELTTANLEWELDISDEWYGFMDYLAFAVKKVFRHFNPSFKGAICSEKVADILKAYGWHSPFKGTPSPADFEKVLETCDAAS